MKTVVIRPIEEKDVPLLEEFTYQAIFQKDMENPIPRSVLEEEGIGHYYRGFLSSPHDCGFLAQVGEEMVGAVWVRILNGEIRGYGYADDCTPEFSIAVMPSWRGCGIGTRLMDEMIRLIQEKGYEKASLSVQRINPAAKLYRRLGFQAVEEREEDDVMVLRLQDYLKWKVKENDKGGIV